MKTFALIATCIIALASFVFFIAPSPMQNVDYLRGDVVHYKGKSTITPYEFILIVEEHGFYFFDRYETISGGTELILAEAELGLVKVEYDAYAPEGIANLTTLEYSIGDMPLFSHYADTWIPIVLILAICPFLAFVLLLFVKLQGTPISTGKTDRFFGSVAYGLLGFWDRMGSKRDVERAVVVDSIKVDTQSLSGIVAVRTWRKLLGSSLKSTAKGTKWRDKVLIADKLPEKDNNSGIYAYCIGSTTEGRNIIGLMFGIVEMSGKFEYHGDGTIRAERCGIRLIVCHKSYYNRGRRISAKYGVPVCFVGDTVEAYHEWLFSENGLECLEHNNRILGETSVLAGSRERK